MCHSAAVPARGSTRTGAWRSLLWSSLMIHAVSSAAANLAAAAAVWPIDPVEPGAPVAGTGYSVFDELTRDGVPFPFEALLARIDQRTGCSQASCIEAVLIPLGRSLQRVAAAPNYFGSPRVVAAVTREGKGPIFARNRLFVGYQPRAALLEVISYNDAAGRFEFQLVHDYRMGAQPRTIAAERTVCVSCHQNHAPIFSRPLWSETHANPAIAAALRAAADSATLRTGRWLGVELQRGVDAPNAIDEATDAANLFAVTQRLWRDACDAHCRPAAIRAALQYRLSGSRHFEPLGDFARQFRIAFPGGLAIPNPDLPNRDPLPPGSTAGPMQANVAAPFEALHPRAPLETWMANDAYLDRKFVLGLATLFAESDLASLRRDPVTAYARIASHAWDGDTIGRGVLRKSLGLDAADEFSRTGKRHRAASPAITDAESTAISPRPIATLPRPAGDFVAPCGACHATAERSPPNFLTGDAAQVVAKLRQCAPRIYVRLAMWQRPSALWTKVPMPPPRAGASGHPWAQTSADPIVATLQQAAGDWIRAEGKGSLTPGQLLEQGYENLRPCLPTTH